MTLSPRRLLVPVAGATQVRCFSDPDGPKQRVVKAKKKKKGTGQQTESARSRELDLVLAALDAPSSKEPPIDDAEKARRYQIGRNYVIGSFERHNEIDHDLTCKIHIKQHALNMLPKGTKLREEALKTDTKSPPLWRNLPVWTPPIPGFDPSQFVDREE